MNPTKRQTGQAGEDLAETYLVKQGFGILGRNFQSKTGEIDLVAQKENNLYFVEIKWRKTSEFGPAIESVSRVKQARIRKTAEYLLMQNPQWKKWIPYFSVLAIDGDETNAMIEFVPDAFM